MSTSDSVCQRQTITIQLSSRAGTPVKIQPRHRHDVCRLPWLVEAEHLDNIHLRALLENVDARGLVGII